MRPLRYAALLALGYGLMAGLYIHYSGAVAARWAASLADLQRIEQVKGLVFVATTALALFLASLFLFRRLKTSLELQQRLLQATATAQSRLLAGELAAAVAHDFNNTLMVADVAIMEARDPIDPTMVATRLRDAAEAIAKGRELALRLAGTARGERFLRLERRDLSIVAKSMVRALSKLPRLFDRKIEFVGAPEAVAEVDVVLFEQMLANLVLNAADACGKHGVIRVVLATDAGHVCLEVHDNGPGIPDDKRARIFQAFETSKPTGLGLGLFSVRAAVQAQGGTLDVGASPLGGAVFIARLPRRKRVSEGNQPK